MKLADISEIEIDEEPFRPRTLAFTKMHGNGNDFIIIDEMRSEQVAESKKSGFAIGCCHRNFGIGADGVLFLVNSPRAELGMRLFQPDGSEAEMCGNGIRCLAKYAWDCGYVGEGFSVETLAGVVPVQVREMDDCFWAKVKMGVPKFDRGAIPAIGSGEFLMEELDGMQISAVNTGVPHAVIFVDDIDLSVDEIAPLIRHNSVFPEGANVNFVRPKEPFEVRTFERGVEAETLSCGTGAVACASVARRLGFVGDEVLVKTRGGPLIVTFEGDDAFMEGPAVTVYSGDVSEEFRWGLLQGM
ncbi:MAG: Diaminopimelate epimerase [Methanosaeta sp. PtaU1.Bin060]|nr:MAG: Diaminopimelate epimerase [Methanosaeta sp. PtaU1.Bin060]